MTAAVLEVVYDALVAIPDCAVYLNGDVPEDAAFPYLVYGPGDTTASRISINSRLQTRDVIVEVIASSIIQAEDLADAVEEAIVGLSVAAADNIDPFPGGFERAQSAWRVYDTDPSEVDGDRYYRIILFFEQRETA